MAQAQRTLIISTGFAIFSMFFGAGNLMYPIKVGMDSCMYPALGIMGFLMTSVLLPLIGLIAMVLYNGDYRAFFNRLGSTIGGVCILLCMLIIGPIIAIPRIVTLSHVMLSPFLPTWFLHDITPLNSFVFAVIFLGITFWATYRPSRIVDLLGNIISPLLLLALGIIIGKGLLFSSSGMCSSMIINPWLLFYKNSMIGYETLDLLGAIFFSSIVIQLLTNSHSSIMARARVCMQSGLLALGALSLIYAGLAVIGALHGKGILVSNAGQLFSILSFKILGSYGAAVIAIAVLMACLSTAIALCAVVAEYIHTTIAKKKICFQSSLMLVVLASLPLSLFGLDAVLKLTAGPIVYIGYPALIVLTICNILYKLVGFKWVKLPVALTTIAATILYFYF